MSVTATGEIFAFPEGRLYLYASASGTTSGSGIGFAQGATLTFAYGWREVEYAIGAPTGNKERHLTGARAELTIENLFGDLALFRLANATAAVNAKFEGVMTGGVSRSAQFVLYSGAVDTLTVNQQDGQSFQGSYSMHSDRWSAFGG